MIEHSEVQFGKREFDWWNTIQAHEKLPYVHIVQGLCMFWLDFGRVFFSCYVMQCKLFGVWVMSKGAKKVKEPKNTFFNLVMIQMMRTFHNPMDLNLIDEALAKATTMALIKWAPWLHDIYKKTILNCCDWCKISKCCDMIGARYIPQCGDLIGASNIPLYTPTQRFCKKKESK